MMTNYSILSVDELSDPEFIGYNYEKRTLCYLADRNIVVDPKLCIAYSTKMFEPILLSNTYEFFHNKLIIIRDYDLRENLIIHLLGGNENGDAKNCND